MRFACLPASEGESRQITRRNASGAVDVVIGLRILSGQCGVSGPGPGRDEERFGQWSTKEKLKQMRTNVDVLAMSVPDSALP